MILKSQIKIIPGRLIKGYINTWRGPKLDTVNSWIVVTPKGNFEDIYPKKTAIKISILAKQGLDITQMKKQELLSAWHLFTYGTEMNPGKNSSDWKKYLNQFRLITP